MERLDTELRRLYLAREPKAGSTRAMVLAASGPGGWDALAAAWRGVQADLQLPAPGIAVSGRDGLELWFSVAEPVDAEQATAFLQVLRSRYLAAVPQACIRMQPEPASDAIPPRQLAPDRWSAFVTPDLAALFGEEPWLDLPPGTEAQADLLSRLQCMSPADLRRACAEAGPGPAPPPVTSAATQHQDARSFLLAVMNDGSVDLRLRIEAAKALLPQGGS